MGSPAVKCVGDDDDGIKDPLIPVVVQAGQPVRQPADGVALAAAGGMLHQVTFARAS